MKLVEKIPLPNKLVVEVWDDSRSIAEDTTKVALLIKINVKVKPEYFAHQEHFKQVLKIFGNETFFEYKIERTFVSNQEKENIFKELLEAFKKDSLPYFARPQFPESFVLSKLMDIQKNPRKYRNHLGEI